MSIVIGVDSGGSKTRALAVTIAGEVVGYGEAGGGNPSHDPAFRDNIRSAIVLAGEPAGLDRVVRIVAGIAGVDRQEDAVWAADATDVPGLVATRIQVNDAVIAHFGGLTGLSGIISIQGDGSMIYARTESGREVRNLDFHHYASAAAPAVGYRAVLILLARGHSVGDESFVSQLLQYWQVDSVEALRDFYSQSYQLPGFELRRRQGDSAHLVTAAAESGSPLAKTACCEAASQVVDGIRLLGREFSEPLVRVVLIGSCVRSTFIRREVEQRLAEATEKTYEVLDPTFPPVVGAVLMALDLEGVELSESLLHRLGSIELRIA